MKTSELQGAALDWAVAKCEGNDGVWYETDKDPMPFTPSTNWPQGGPIIEQKRIDSYYNGEWNACCRSDQNGHPDYWEGPTLLIAAMRCYVASRLGDDVTLPDGLV
jgi:hypothetical protein